MRIKCLINDLSKLDEPAKKRLADEIHIEGPMSELTVGQTYVVQAVAITSGDMRYYIHGDEALPWPSPWPSELFAIEDASIPPGWYAHVESEAGITRLKRLAFAEWDDHFYEKLLDEDEDALNVYERRRLSK